MDFQDFINHELDERKISKVKFADMVGYEYDTVVKWCNGISSPRWNSFEDVLNTLGYEIQIVKRGK